MFTYITRPTGVSDSGTRYIADGRIDADVYLAISTQWQQR